MKLATIIGMLTATLAVILYSFGVWMAFRKKEYSSKALLLLDAGVIMDITATLAMASTVGWTLKYDTAIWAVKTTLALLAMLGMIIVTAVGYWAKSTGNAKVMVALTSWALAPWALWVFVYLWGSARIGLK
ncbi:MAG: hypothetical protein Q7W30_07835 [Coriobacteriia bacterium]|nr:hypothetical protein [Coriobacteriia bacterium]